MLFISFAHSLAVAFSASVDSAFVPVAFFAFRSRIFCCSSVTFCWAVDCAFVAVDRLSAINAHRFAVAVFCAAYSNISISL